MAVAMPVEWRKEPNMSKWIWIKFEVSKSHLVEERFVEHVLRDLKDRDCGELEKFEETNGEFYLDPGGMCLVNEPSETLPAIDGLVVGVMSRAVSSFASMAEKLQVREGGYVKLHGHWTCIVMSPEQRDRLVVELRKVADSANQRVEQHFEEWKKERHAVQS